MNHKSYGALLLACGIALGAFGAHGLRPLLEVRSMEVYQTAVFYLLVNSLGLMLVHELKGPSKLLLAGIFCFSGSLLLLSTSSVHGLPVAWLGPVTPLGGLLLMGGWLWAAWHWWQAKKNEKQA